jgi:pyruvate kinase
VRKAKILATLGPASREPAVIEGMLAAGVNAVRVNMSHGEREEHAETLKTVRAAAAMMDRPLSVLIDLSGPKIRTGKLASGPVTLIPGEQFVLTSRDVPGDEHEVSTNYDGMAQDVKPGGRLLLDDGALELVVERTTDTDVICRVIVGGLLSDRKGINLPGALLPIPSMTKKDRSDLIWAVEQNADYIALSFVRTAADCVEAKELIKTAGGRAHLVAKIEKAEAIDNLDEIMAATDAVMVARGDLGVETSPELVPVYQKRIIRKANDAGKVVVTATQMLQSMVNNPRPSRAESSDVANAVWDGSDAVMLSNETAVGKYPVLTVATMARIIESAEVGNPVEGTSGAKWAGKQTGRVSRALCEAAAYAAEEMRTKTTAVFTESGLMGRRLAALRPNQQIVALTSLPDVRNELALVWGVNPLIHEVGDSTEEMLQMGEKTLLDAGIVTPGEVLVMMAGRMSGLGLSSSVVIYRVGGELGPS